MKLLSRLFFFLAIVSLFIGVTLLYKRINPTKLRFTSPPQAQASENKPLIPTSIEIPSLNLQLPIYPARITNNTWETTDRGVSYLMSSVTPGEKGNSILYGHNFTNILGNLPQIKPGEKIVVALSHGKKKIFIVDKTAIVDPSDDSILKSSETAALTIYTCTGFLDSKRFVVHAVPTKEI